MVQRRLHVCRRRDLGRRFHLELTSRLHQPGQRRVTDSLEAGWPGSRLPDPGAQVVNAYSIQTPSALEYLCFTFSAARAREDQRTSLDTAPSHQGNRINRAHEKSPSCDRDASWRPFDKPANLGSMIVQAVEESP